MAWRTLYSKATGSVEEMSLAYDDSTNLWTHRKLYVLFFLFLMDSHLMNYRVFKGLNSPSLLYTDTHTDIYTNIGFYNLVQVSNEIELDQNLVYKI